LAAPSCNDRGISSTTELAENHAVERLPASSSFLAVRLVLSAPLIPIFWLWLGAPAGEAAAAALAAVFVLFFPRAIVLDEQGFRVVSLFPRKKVLWNAVTPSTPAMCFAPAHSCCTQKPDASHAGGIQPVGRRRAASPRRLPPDAETEPYARPICAICLTTASRERIARRIARCASR
jgi:hypothetical protein